MIHTALFEIPPITDKWETKEFSANNFGQQIERIKLEKEYIKITDISDKFNRKNVSYQLSKNNALHRWLRYKEGFSSELVRILLNDFNIKEGDTVLDPFAGSGTTNMVCKMHNINSICFDILPLSEIVINAKQAIFDYNLLEIKQLIQEVSALSTPQDYPYKTPYINITYGAYPENTTKDIAFITEWNAKSHHSKALKNLITLTILNSLEKISYTSKDGQFLRWDYRSEKMQETQKKRQERGIPSLSTKLDKGELPTLKQSIIQELHNIYEDILYIQKQTKPNTATLHFSNNSALFELPKIPNNSIHAVITSPPYCNRYDYTRTYALELAYLGSTDTSIKQLRQALLSWTVENRSKIQELNDLYLSLNKEKDFYNVLQLIENNPTLNEINNNLIKRSEVGDINNRGILQMVKGYFTELTFVYIELFRVCKSGAKVAFVNDNVRYGGEIIPVDYISTYIAQQIGFKPVKIYSLKQQKGNSSQQMAKFGRAPLRKSITIWEKP